MSDGGQIPKCAVVLVAAGKGERLGAALPKQFAPLAGAPLFAHSARVLLALPFVTEIVLVVPAEGLPDDMKAFIAQEFPALRCVAGGARRQDSAAAGLAALQTDYDVALVHDAARPFPEPAAIADLAFAAQTSGGALLAEPAVDTIKQADAAGCVTRTLDRTTLWHAQTPQAIRADLVPRAIAEMRRADLQITDEAMLMESWGIPVRLVRGGARNFKLTHPGDFARAEQLIQSKTG